MNISYDYYRVFYQVAACKSITRAARALFIGQPNVTRTIKLLEQELGCPLFLRSNRGMTLTPEGELLLRHVAPAVEHLEAAQRELTLERELRQGSVSIGASEVSLRCLLLPVLKRFREEYPGIRVRVSNHSTPQAVRALQEGLVDLAVVTTPLDLPRGMEQRPLKQIREIPVCAGTYADELQGTVSPELLSRYPLICLSRDTMTYRLYSQWFSQNGLAFHPEVEAATADQILPMVKNFLGIGFVPREFLRDEISGAVSPIALSVPLPARDICLLKRTDRSLPIAARRFEEMLRGPRSLSAEV